MTIHSGVLAWEIPWTEKPAGLQGVTKESDTTGQLSTFRTANDKSKDFLK